MAKPRRSTRDAEGRPSMFSTRVKPTKLPKRERKVVVACAKDSGGTPGDIFRCAERALNLTPSSMTSDQYARLQAASFKAARSANRAAIRRNYGMSGARRRKKRRR